MSNCVTKKQALMIALSLVEGEKTKDDYGFSALKESELIIQNMLDAIEMEKENTTSKLHPKWDSIPATNPKSRTTFSSRGDKQYVTEILKQIECHGISSETILDLEK